MNVLVVEDNHDHRELIKFVLEEHDPSWKVSTVGTGEDALELLAEEVKFEIILLDYSLPNEDGLAVMKKISKMKNAPPVVMVTGLGNQDTAVAVMKAGAYDYVVKTDDYLLRLPIVAKRAVENHKLKSMQVQAEAALRQSEERYRNLVENAPTGILSIDLEGNIQEVNPKLLEFLGSPSAEETKKINVLKFLPLVDSGISMAFQKCIESGESSDSTHPYTSKWSKSIYARLYLTPIFDNQEQIIGVQGNVVDISKRMDALKQLEQLNNQLEERVVNRTRELETLVGAMAGREVRMADLKRVIKKLRKQIKDSGMEPIADDPLNEPI